MGLRIATNMQSLTAQRHLGTSNNNQRTSIEKLSAGSRITKAADDAAGLAISEKMRADIRSVRQDIRNANDGISLIQTGEGAMNEIGNILVRFRELSIQGATDTLGDRERSFIDKEVQQLKQEIDRIAKSTQFNGRSLLNGEGEVLEFQVGLNSDPVLDRFTYDVAGVNSTAQHLGVSELSTATKQSSQENLMKIDQAIQVLSENRANLGALQNRLGSTVNNLQIYDENLSAARSRISDVDMANETAELTKQNILTTAGISVLGQANQNNTQALKLL